MFYKNSKDSGYSPDDFGRFDILRGLEFGSVLDVGSGPCQLQKWLRGLGVDPEYEAVDLREDALEHCDCRTYVKVPSRKKYDLVCLFGTADYCRPADRASRKAEFEDLLLTSAKRARSLVVFSAVKPDPALFNMVQHTLEEVQALASRIGSDYSIDSDLEPTEFLVVVRLA